MDLMATLALASQTVKVVKDLRDLERDFDAASYKAKMAELYGNLADIKMALSDANELLHEKDAEIKKLKADLAAAKSGEICPICESGNMKVISVKPHHIFGNMGLKVHTLKCTNCDHTDTIEVHTVR